ncbi:MAG TPA: hypothetical protein VGK30_08855 [Candidatus Binatia bacterium]
MRRLRRLARALHRRWDAARDAVDRWQARRRRLRHLERVFG